jgi:hypothetical protein
VWSRGHHGATPAIDTHLIFTGVGGMADRSLISIGCGCIMAVMIRNICRMHRTRRVARIERDRRERHREHEYGRNETPREH